MYVAFYGLCEKRRQREKEPKKNIFCPLVALFFCGFFPIRPRSKVKESAGMFSMMVGVSQKNEYTDRRKSVREKMFFSPVLLFLPREKPFPFSNTKVSMLQRNDIPKEGEKTGRCLWRTMKLGEGGKDMAIFCMPFHPGLVCNPG